MLKENSSVLAKSEEEKQSDVTIDKISASNCGQNSTLQSVNRISLSYNACKYRVTANVKGEETNVYRQRRERSPA